MKTFKEDLQRKIDDATEKFEQAKKDAIKELETMNCRTAIDFGAAYATHIDNVTRYASRLVSLAEMMDAYNYYDKQEQK